MTKTVRVLALGDAMLRDALIGRDSGGEHLADGLAEVAGSAYPDYAVSVDFVESGPIGELRSSLPGIDADVVILATTRDVQGLTASDPQQATRDFHDDLVAAVDAIKERGGSHVLVSNVSTFDPDDETSSLYGLAEEPMSMRAHRINLALLQISHEIGISIIDVDRIAAEAGCGRIIPAALELTPQGSALVRDETARVLADYGFFDERSVVEQVGNRGSDK